MALRVISYSELDTMRQCPHKHQLSYIERWTTQQATMSALSKGTAWHATLEAHYRALMARQKGVTTGPSPTDAAAAVIAELPGELATLIEWMYSGHLEHWGLDDQWQILGVEHNAQVRLPTPAGGNSAFILKIKVDVVIKDRRRGNIYVVDHKSGKDLPKAKMLELDDQFGLYVWGLQRLGKKVFGCMYNAARTYRTKEAQPLNLRFDRIPLYRTPAELKMIATEAYLTAQARYRQQADCERRGIDAPRHTNTQTCNWRCDYVEACLFGRKTNPRDERQFLRDKSFTQDFSRH